MITEIISENMLVQKAFAADRIYDYVWQRSAGGEFPSAEVRA